MTSGKKSARPASSVFHAVTHVWGRHYLDMFLNVCVPNQLAPGNIPALPEGSRYRILTHSRHFAELESHPSIGALRDVIPVDIVGVEALERGIDTMPGYQLMIACHRQAIADIFDAGAAMLALSADFVFSRDAFAAVVERHRQGCRGVATTGVRLIREDFIDALERSGASLRALSSRELVRLAWPHLHPYTRAMFVDAHPFKPYPEAVYWPVGSEGFVARCLPLHPLMLDPESRVLPENTIDGRYFGRACPEFSRVHMVADSDELQMFELTSSGWQFEQGPAVGTPAWRTALVAVTCDDLQNHFWRQGAVTLHGGDLDERWTAAVRASDEFATRVAQLRPYAELAGRLRHSSRPFQRVSQHLEHEWKALRRRLPRVQQKQLTRPLKIASKRVNKMWRSGLRAVRHTVGSWAS